MAHPSSHPVLLALRALSLGDLLLAVPALRGLRAAFPQHEFILAAPPSLRPIVPLIGGINRLLATQGLSRPLEWRNPVDVAVDLHGPEPESRSLLDALGPTHRVGHEARGWAGPTWENDVHERERWVRMLSWHGIPAQSDNYLLCPPEAPARTEGATILHVGAARGGAWWPAERYAAVAAVLARRGHDVVVTGGRPDSHRGFSIAAAAGLPRRSCVAGKWNLEEFAAAVACAKIVITADSSAGHLATAYRTPSVVMFGSHSPERWGPPEEGPHRALAPRRMAEGAAPDSGLGAILPGHVLDAVDQLEANDGMARR